jgi:sporulation protein YlmC with PRC-barrel domain
VREVDLYGIAIRQPELATLEDGVHVLATENVQGFEVRDIDNHPVGRVDDLVVDREAGHVRFLEIADNGFLGLGVGREHCLVPVDVIQDVAGDTVFLKITHDVVDFAPKWRPLSDGTYVSSVLRYFGCTPFWSSDYRTPEWTTRD